MSSFGFFQLSSLNLGLRHLSMVRVADDSGIIKARVIAFFRNRWATGGIGMKCHVIVNDKTENYKGPKTISTICVRRKQTTRRKDGSYLSFSDNAVVPLVKNKPLGSKIRGT